MFTPSSSFIGALAWRRGLDREGPVAGAQTWRISPGRNPLRSSHAAVMVTGTVHAAKPSSAPCAAASGPSSAAHGGGEKTTLGDLEGRSPAGRASQDGTAAD